MLFIDFKCTYLINNKSLLLISYFITRAMLSERSFLASKELSLFLIRAKYCILVEGWITFPSFLFHQLIYFQCHKFSFSTCEQNSSLVDMIINSQGRRHAAILCPTINRNLSNGILNLKFIISISCLKLRNEHLRRQKSTSFLLVKISKVALEFILQALLLD